MMTVNLTPHLMIVDLEIEILKQISGIENVSEIQKLLEIERDETLFKEKNGMEKVRLRIKEVCKEEAAHDVRNAKLRGLMSEDRMTFEEKLPTKDELKKVALGKLNYIHNLKISIGVIAS